jgi:large subunit ribosomal protein L15
MKLEDLRPHDGAKKKRKRIGRGPGSGHGRTATKGAKGQIARSGGTKGKGFEGGQMPLTRRIPKKGFKNPFRKEYAVVKVGDLALFKDTGKAGVEDFTQRGLVAKLKDGIKLLADGDLDFAIKVTVHKASKQAIEKIRSRGGEVEVLS